MFLQLPRELSRKSLGGSLIAEKLDSLMVLTFEHLESCKDSGRLVEVLLDVQIFNGFDLPSSVTTVQFYYIIEMWSSGF